MCFLFIKFFVHLFVIWMIGATLVENLQYSAPEYNTVYPINHVAQWKFSPWGDAIFSMINLRQAWNMFTPRPPNVNWHYSIEATLGNSSIVDLWSDGGVHKLTARPYSDIASNVPESFGSHGWFKFHENAYNNGQAMDDVRLEYGKYVCRQWNGKYGSSPTEKLVTFKVYWISVRHNFDYTRSPDRKIMLWHHIC